MVVARESVAGLDEALAAIVQRAAEVAQADVVVARLAEQFGGVLQLPVRDGAAVVGSLELLRRRGRFDERDRGVARAAADEIALARRAFGDGDASSVAAPDLLALAGDALAAGSDESRAADQVAALAAEATGALSCLVWWYEEEDQEPLLAGIAGPGATAAPIPALDAVRRAHESREPVAVEELEDGAGALATLQLGEPPLGALQLFFPDPDSVEPLVPRLGPFAVRAAHALRASERRRSLSADLERTRALLAIVSQAIAEMSLAHTLETAVERLRELALGPARGRGLVLVSDAADDPRVASVRGAVEELGIEAAIGVPLRARDELIGLLAAYPEQGRALTENEESLLRALAAQLAVAVQNARLHEQVEQESEEVKRARDEALEASRRLRALYEISRSFTEGLSLEETLDAVARTIVEALRADGAALRMPHERGDELVPVA